MAERPETPPSETYQTAARSVRHKAAEIAADVAATCHTLRTIQNDLGTSRGAVLSPAIGFYEGALGMAGTLDGSLVKQDALPTSLKELSYDVLRLLAESPGIGRPTVHLYVVHKSLHRIIQGVDEIAKLKEERDLAKRLDPDKRPDIEKTHEAAMKAISHSISNKYEVSEDADTLASKRLDILLTPPAQT